MMAVAPADSNKDKTPKMVPNPEYGSWLSRDQTVLSYLLKSLSKEILTHVLRIEHTIGVWCAVEEMFASQNQSKITNLRIDLANTKRIRFLLLLCSCPRCKGLQTNLQLLPALFQMMNSSPSSWPVWALNKTRWSLPLVSLPTDFNYASCSSGRIYTGIISFVFLGSWAGQLCSTSWLHSAAHDARADAVLAVPAVHARIFCVASPRSALPSRTAAHTDGHRISCIARWLHPFYC
ncbi:hypothetical protein QYE76_020838 [Lolium multiflorum]|uniref:Uncharacterized protein n=1 Tax=Lolium multiflorum TaxID=4521 RepID=A0AAD8VRP8_LOLMU|nr:hypothetical protein QYE76_020838 [Lolium multiflorum]